MAGETDPEHEDEIEHNLKMQIEDEKARYGMAARASSKQIHSSSVVYLGFGLRGDKVEGGWGWAFATYISWLKCMLLFLFNAVRYMVLYGMNVIIIIIAAFIMRTYPSSEDVQGATYYYYPGRLIQFQDRTCSAQFPLPREHSLPSCLSWRSGKYIHNISFTSYRVPIYTPGWRAAMWIKCLAEGQKC